MIRVFVVSFLFSSVSLANDDLAKDRKITAISCSVNNLCYVYFDGPRVPVKNCERANIVFDARDGQGKVWFAQITAARASKLPVTFQFHSSNCVGKTGSKNRLLNSVSY